MHGARRGTDLFFPPAPPRRRVLAGGSDDRAGGGTDDAGGGGAAVDTWQLVWASAGILGVHPGEWTLRQLIAARDGRLESDWWHTAQLLAQFYNANRTKGAPALPPAKFNPFAREVPVRKRAATEEDLRMLFGG